MANYNNIRFYPVEGYRPYYETPDGRVHYGPPVTFEDPDPRNTRDHVGAPSTSSYGAHFGGGGQPDGFRRDWRDGGHGCPYLHDVAPVEQVYGLQYPGWWLNGSYPHGGHEGYQIWLPVHNTADNEERHEQKTVTLWVPMCCQDCERKVKTQLEDTEGVESVTTDQISHKVVVIGTMRPESVLNHARWHKPESQFWSDRPAYRQ